MEKTYKGWQEWKTPSKQPEYTEPTTLLGEDGTLLATVEFPQTLQHKFAGCIRAV